MSRETKIIKRFTNELGTISASNITPAKVRFNLTVTREFLDDMPMLKSGHGSIEFANPRQAGEFFSSRGSATLKSENVEAQILVTKLDGFVTTGPVVWDGAPGD